jgi:hypothetical protein
LSYPIEHYKQPPLPPQNFNPQAVTNQNIQSESKKNGALMGMGSKRQFYYTLENEIELDPEIANDLSLYVKN